MTRSLILTILLFCAAIGIPVAHMVHASHVPVADVATSAALASPVVLPDVTADPGGFAQAMYGFLVSRDYLILFAGALTLVVFLLRRYVKIGTSKIGGWALNAGVAIATTMSTALLAGKPLMPAVVAGLLAGVTAALTAAGVLEVSKDAGPAVLAAARRVLRRSGPALYLLTAGLAVSTSVQGCAWWSSHGPAIMNGALACGEAAVKAEIGNVTPAVMAILSGDAPDWQAQLDALEAVGSTAVLCAVQAVVGNLKGPGTPVDVRAIARAQVYLRQAGVTR